MEAVYEEIHLSSEMGVGKICNKTIKHKLQSYRGEELIKTYDLGAQKNLLSETALLSSKTNE